MATVSIGDTLSRKDGRRFELTGTLNDSYVLSDLDGPFSAPFVLTLDELRSSFDVDYVATPKTEAQIREQLDRDAAEKNAAYFGRNPSKPRLLPPEDSPERKFVDREAQSIFADADRLAAFEIGELEVSPPVALVLDALIADRNQANPVKPKAKAKPAPRRRRGAK
jgi:hypothetical protein